MNYVSTTFLLGAANASIYWTMSNFDKRLKNLEKTTARTEELNVKTKEGTDVSVSCPDYVKISLICSKKFYVFFLSVK